MEQRFGKFATAIATRAGSPVTFALAVFLVLAWAISGPAFGFSDSWQMAINTGTTICTFLMVFIIQNSQNRDGLALQIKLDELIRALDSAKNDMIDLESLSNSELEKLREKFAAMATTARETSSNGERNSPDGEQAVN